MAGTGKPTIDHSSGELPEDKIENYGATSEGRVSASEFNKFKEYVAENDSNIRKATNNAIFGVRMPGQQTPLYPDSEGIVTLTSSSANVVLYFQDNQTTITSFDGTVTLHVAAVATDSSGSTYSQEIIFKLYKVVNNVETLVFTGTIQSSANPNELTYYDVPVSDVIESTITTYRATGTSELIGITSSKVPLSIRKINAYVTNRREINSVYSYPNASNTFDVEYQVFGLIPDSEGNDDSANRKVYIRVYKDGDVETEASPKELNVDYIQEEIIGATLGISTKPIALGPTARSIVNTFKVHAVEIWMTYTNGSLSYTSSKVVTRHLLHNEAAAALDTTPKLILGDTKMSIDNYIQATITKYALFVFSNTGAIDYTTPRTFAFKLRESTTEYLSVTQTTLGGVVNEFTSTVEIEPSTAEEPDYYDVGLYATMDGVTEDLISSAGTSNPIIRINNQYKFSPTSGATFVLNPKTRSNTEDNWRSIINAVTGTTIQSVWSNSFNGGDQDGWVASDGTTVLRIPAGRTLNFTGLTPFYPLRADNTGYRAVTIDFDFKIYDVVNPEDTSIVSIGEMVGTLFKGLNMNALDGTFTHGASMTDEDKKDCIFAWRENTRTHISINIYPGVDPKSDDHRISLIRIFINGKICREIVYDSSLTSLASEFANTAYLKIGSEYASIDLYSIRVYENKLLSPSDIVKNYIATLPTTEQKLSTRIANNITNDDGSISLSKIVGETGTKKNTIIMYCDHEPMNGRVGNSSESYGYYEIYIYDNAGNLDTNRSGTIGKATYDAYVDNNRTTTDNLVPLSFKRQGTTANTYAYSNQQSKIKDIVGTVQVLLSNLNPAFITYTVITEDNIQKAKLTGGNLDGKKYTIYSNSDGEYIQVPDGWFTFDGKYNGVGYQVKENTPLAQKVVNKINYASSMQSHLAGGVMSYNDLHTAIVGENVLQKLTDHSVHTPGAFKARVTKCVEPFFYFVQDYNLGETSPTFRGLCTFGSGKMDKQTWGLVKSDYFTGGGDDIVANGFCMIEGASNNNPITDMRVPFFDADVQYDGDAEGYVYNGINNLDVDEGDPDVCTANIKAAWNWLYLHNPKIAPFVGTYTEFHSVAEAYSDYNYTNIESFYSSVDRGDMVQGMYIYIGTASGEITTAGTHILTTKGADRSGDIWTPTTTLEKTYSYWITGGTINRFNLYRFDYKSDKWIDAGIDTSTETIVPRNLRTDFPSIIGWTTESPEVLNEKVIEQIAIDGRANIGNYFVEESLQFHYAYVNYLIAGTDNCSKNTYYVYVPRLIDESGPIEASNIEWKFELHQDDLDTIFMTDNSAWMTKPYYIDREHPYTDDTHELMYEGTSNVLFNLCEAMWGEQYATSDTTGLISRMLKRIFQVMYSNSGSVWNYFDKYYFSVQKYFPEVAWNEQARIRYEYPQAIGFLSDTRNVKPISQSLGDQLQSESQYMIRRLVMASGYAFYGYATSGESLGISELQTGLTGQMNVSYGNFMYFALKPHQYIYPCYNLGDNRIATYHRIKPTETYNLVINIESVSGDAGVGLQGVNFYQEIGNIGNNPWTSTPLSINGKRLKKVEINPTSSSVGIHSGNISFEGADYPKNATELNFAGMVNTGIANNNDLSEFKRAKIINLTGVPIASIILPTDGVLETLNLTDTNLTTFSLSDCKTIRTVIVSKNTTSLTIQNCPLLTTLTIQSGSSINSITIRNCSSLANISIPASIRNITLYNCASLTSIINTTTVGALANLKTLSITSCPRLNKYSVISRFCQDNATLTSLSIDTLTSSIFDYSYLNKILNIPTITTGDSAKSWDINMSESSSSSYGMKFSTKVAVLAKFGNVDSNSNRVKITYNQTNPATEYTISVRGNMYTRATGVYTYTLIPSTQNLNHFSSFTWQIIEKYPTSGAQAVYTLSTNNAVSNNLTVSSLGSAGEYIRIGGALNLTNGSTLSYENRKVSLWDRQAELGDYVYADGDYSNEVDSSRTVIGICVYADTDPTTQRHPTLGSFYKQRRLAVSMRNLGIVGSYQTESINAISIPWGLYTNLSSSTATAASENANSVHKFSENYWRWYTLLDDPTYNMYNLSATANITNTGSKLSFYIYSGAYTDSNSSNAVFNLGTVFTTDQDDNTYANYNTAWGDGFYKNEPEGISALIPNRATVVARELPENLVNLTRIDPTDRSSHTEYEVGDVVCSGYIKTLQIIQHRNKILSDTLCDGDHIDMGDIPSASGSITEAQSLGTACAKDRYSATTKGLSGSSYTKYWQMHYPAASACYAYEPTVKEGEILADKFKRHNWFLPPEGILARMCWYCKQAAGGSGIHKNIFDNANANNTAIGWSNFTASFYWSSTEYSINNSWYTGFSNGGTYYDTKYYGYYVRALVAF